MPVSPGDEHVQITQAADASGPPEQGAHGVALADDAELVEGGVQLLLVAAPRRLGVERLDELCQQVRGKGRSGAVQHGDGPGEKDPAPHAERPFARAVAIGDDAHLHPGERPNRRERGGRWRLAAGVHGDYGEARGCRHRVDCLDRASHDRRAGGDYRLADEPRSVHAIAVHHDERRMRTAIGSRRHRPRKGRERVEESRIGTRALAGGQRSLAILRATGNDRMEHDARAPVTRDVTGATRRGEFSAAVSARR